MTWTNAVAATTSLAANLRNLAANSVYDWQVRATCGSSVGANAQAQFTTAPACPGAYDVSTNGTPDGAAQIPFNTDIKGTISASGDNDYYRFVISTGGTATVTLSTLPANYDLRLYSSNGASQIAISQKNGTTNETISRTFTAGTYYVRVYGNKNVSNANSCYTLRIALGTAGRTMEVAGLNVINMNLHPNPAHQLLHISLNNDNDEKTIEIVDLMGKVVLKEKTRQQVMVLRLGNLPAGLYLVQISARDGAVISRDKFVKE